MCHVQMASLTGGSSCWLLFSIPLTVFYFIALFFKINITSSPLFGFVYAIQSISHPQLIRLYFVYFQGKPSFLLVGLRILESLCGIWNLDFIRSTYQICLGTDTLQTLALELAIGVYHLPLMMLSYLLIVFYGRNIYIFIEAFSKYCLLLSYQLERDPRTSTVDIFATFFLLCNVKFLSISYDLLAPAKVYQLNSTGSLTHSWGLYYDASQTYFGKEHLPYAILAIASFLFFVLFPILLLALYPFRWFQKLLNLFPFRWYILHTFVDSFQGCYKDGTTEEDSRLSMVCFTVLSLATDILFPWITGANTAIFCHHHSRHCVIVNILVTVQPFKEDVRHYSTINAGFLLLLAIGMVNVLALHMSRIWGHHDQLLLITMIVFGVIFLLYSSGAEELELHSSANQETTSMEAWIQCVVNRVSCADVTTMFSVLHSLLSVGVCICLL